jgi:HSP20 family protein
MTKATLVRRQPRRTSLRVRDPFFSEFDRFFNDETLRPSSLFGRWMGEDLRDVWVPPVDVQETDESYLFTAELPGLGKDDVDITLEDNLLTLSGERKLEERQEGKSYHRVERAYGSFSRSFSLPAQVDGDKVAAKFEEGLLRIEIPKAEQVKPRKIDIS